MTHCVRLVALVTVFGLLAACTSTVTLRHPQTGATVECGPYYSAGLYYGRATERERTCVYDYQRQGYERVPGGSVASAPPAPGASQPSPPSGGISGTYAGEIAATVEGRAI